MNWGAAIHLFVSIPCLPLRCAHKVTSTLGTERIIFPVGSTLIPSIR